jgi:aryl-alcohol dehydrogenase-like predicted oxidoreductase
MSDKVLGKNHLFRRPLGIGCWSFGGGSYWGPQDQKDIEEVVHCALDQGINYFDTAELYNDGKSEESLGIALKKRRHEAIIGTKFSPQNAGMVGVRNSLEGSLKRLGTDYVDVYFVHWPLPTKTSEERDVWLETWNTLVRLQEEGKVRALGLSNHGVLQMNEIRNLGVPIVANQLPYNVLSRAIECEITEICKDFGWSIIAYSPLNQGLLTGKYRHPEEVRSVLARTRHFHWSRGQGQSRHHGEGAETEVFRCIEDLRTLANSYGITVSQLALAWVLFQPYVAMAIVGARNVNQLCDHLDALTYRVSEEIDCAVKSISDPLFSTLGCNPDYYEDPTNSRIR